MTQGKAGLKKPNPNPIALKHKGITTTFEYGMVGPDQLAELLEFVQDQGMMEMVEVMAGRLQEVILLAQAGLTISAELSRLKGLNGELVEGLGEALLGYAKLIKGGHFLFPEIKMENLDKWESILAKCEGVATSQSPEE